MLAARVPERGQSKRRWHAPPVCAVVTLGALVLAGCQVPGRGGALGERGVADAARPILDLDPNANWTACFNQLVELGPDSIEYLMQQPAMTRPAPPDDLSVLVHTSLLRRLASVSSSPPTLSANCLETSLDILHFDIRVGARSLGTIVWAERAPPRAWHELYPLDFDHHLAAQIDLEGDRRALCAWWAANRGNPSRCMTSRYLQPVAARLWSVLSRRYADAWLYEAEPRAVLCAAGPPRQPVLLQVVTYDYNLVRATCIWLGSSSVAEVKQRLVELVGSSVSIVSCNARFALRYARDPAIRAVIERYDGAR